MTRIRNLSTINRRVRKADHGHSIVQQSYWTVGSRARERRAITCQCGKRFTGWGHTSYYSWTRHLRDNGLTVAS
jgi:hypothetical protein